MSQQNKRVERQKLIGAERGVLEMIGERERKRESLEVFQWEREREREREYVGVALVWQSGFGSRTT